MTASAEKLTIATSSGLVWLTLIFHFSAGLLALGSGFVAIVSTKGGRVHRRAGMIFVVAMIGLVVFAGGLYAFKGRYASLVGAAFPAYLVITALTTVRPLDGRYARSASIALMLLCFGVALNGFTWGTIALNSPTRMLDGAPAPMILFLATVALCAAIGDWRLIRAGSITGTRRIARHLWRMCFGLFVASGSFFLGQMKFLPQSLRILPLLLALGISPLLVLVYWMWRVRLRKKSGLVFMRDAPVA